jgi:hypothetical protein
MAQLLLQQGMVPEALKYFERAAELSRTEGEIVHALQYAEATRVQLDVRYEQFFSMFVFRTPIHVLAMPCVQNIPSALLQADVHYSS